MFLKFFNKFSVYNIFHIMDANLLIDCLYLIFIICYRVIRKLRFIFINIFFHF